MATGQGLAVSFAIGLWAAASGSAEAGPRPDEIYFRYHAAIRAAVLFEGQMLEPKGFGDPEWDRIAENRGRIDKVIHARVPGVLSAGACN